MQLEMSLDFLIDKGSKSTVSSNARISLQDSIVESLIFFDSCHSELAFQLSYLLFFNFSLLLFLAWSNTVPEHGQRLHAHLQPNLHDVADRPLVRLLTISRADATRIST